MEQFIDSINKGLNDSDMLVQVVGVAIGMVFILMACVFSLVSQCRDYKKKIASEIKDKLRTQINKEIFETRLLVLAEKLAACQPVTNYIAIIDRKVDELEKRFDKCAYPREEVVEEGEQ